MNKTNKVYPLVSGVIGEENDKSCINKTWDALFASTIKESLDEVDDKIENLCTSRKEEIERIVRDGQCSVPARYFLWIFAGIGMGIAAVFVGFVFWPRDNVFLHQEYWYQCLLPCILVWMGESFRIVQLELS